MIVKSIMQLMSFIVVFLSISISSHAQMYSLDKCVETAFENNKKLVLDQNRIIMGQDKQRLIKANRLPKVGIETDYKYFVELPYQLMPQSVFGGPEGQFKEAQFGVPHNINANLQVVMPIYNPQLKSKMEMAKIGIELAELQYEKSKEQIYFDISNLYYNAQILKSQMNFIQGNIIANKKLLANITLLKEQKLVKGTDVDKISLQILQLESKMIILNGNYEQVLNGMKVMMGIGLNEVIDIDPTIEHKNGMDYQSLSTVDVRLMETKNKLLRSELTDLKKSLLPSVVSYGSLGVIGYGYDQSPNEFLEFYPMGFVGVKATYGLFDGNKTKKKKKLKQQEITNNSIQLSLIADQNELKVINAKLKREIAVKSIETTLSQIDFAQKIYDQTIFQHKNGVASLTDILLADTVLRESQQNYLSAIIDFMKSDLELKQLSGNIN